MFYLLRSPAIVCDQLRLCDHMETKVLRSAIETYPIVICIPTHDSTLLSNKARIFVFRIITQVIIEILALSLAENGVIFRFIT